MRGKRETSEVFRQRLTVLVAQSGLNQTAFARRAGLDRSVVANLLSDGKPRLPSAETLIAIARACDVATDWLLGLAPDPGLTAHPREAFETHPAAGYGDMSLMEQWHQEAMGQKIRSVPARLPALFRTPELIAFENRGQDGDETADRARTAYQLNHSRQPESDMETCMSTQTIHEFAAGAGRWRNLEARVRRTQLDRMATVLEELYPSFRLYFHDGMHGFLLPQVLFGYTRATIFAGEFYLVIHARQTIRDLTRAFDAQVRQAKVQAHDAPTFLRRLRP